MQVHLRAQRAARLKGQRSEVTAECADLGRTGAIRGDLIEAAGEGLVPAGSNAIGRLELQARARGAPGRPSHRKFPLFRLEISDSSAARKFRKWTVDIEFGQSIISNRYR